MEVADLCDSSRPDERSVMTYIASFFHAFSSMGIIVSFVCIVCTGTDDAIPDQAETVSRRLEKFAELMQSIWVSRNDYERRVRAVCPVYTLLDANKPNICRTSFSTL